MKKKYKWEEYKDLTEEFIKSKSIDMDDDDEDFDDEDEEQLEGVSSKLLSTPLGITSIGGPSFISKYLYVWVLHTNFDITPDIVEKINVVRGIEGLQVMGRYKIKICIPKTDFFDIEQVKSDVIEAILGDENRASEQMDKFISQIFENKINFSEVRRPISEKYDNWAIYILPNGRYEILLNNTNLNEYNNMLKIYGQMVELVGGKLITNKEYE